MVTVQYLHSHAQNPLKIAYSNEIFACWPMFSYGQRSKCADLLNSYTQCTLGVFHVLDFVSTLQGSGGQCPFSGDDASECASPST